MEKLRSSAIFWSESLHLEPDADWDPATDPAPRTQFLRAATRSIKRVQVSKGRARVLKPRKPCGVRVGSLNCLSRSGYRPEGRFLVALSGRRSTYVPTR